MQIHQSSFFESTYFQTTLVIFIRASCHSRSSCPCFWMLSPEPQSVICLVVQNHMSVQKYILLPCSTSMSALKRCLSQPAAMTPQNETMFGQQLPEKCTGARLLCRFSYCTLALLLGALRMTSSALRGRQFTKKLHTDTSCLRIPHWQFLKTCCAAISNTNGNFLFQQGGSAGMTTLTK